MVAKKAKSKSQKKRIAVQEEAVAEKFPMHEGAQKASGKRPGRTRSPSAS